MKNSQKPFRGYLFDIYPTSNDEMAVWIIAEDGKRVRLTDTFRPQVYVSGKPANLERLAGILCQNPAVASFNFAYKYIQPSDVQKGKVLEVTLKSCRQISSFTNSTLKAGYDELYEVHNCNLQADRAYLFHHDLFPLAYVEVSPTDTGLQYVLLDSTEKTNYDVPKLQVTQLEVTVAKKGKMPLIQDPIKTVQLSQNEKQLIISKATEKDTLLELVQAVKLLDPDVILTCGGDSYMLPYLAQRAAENDVLDKFILSRDKVGFTIKDQKGKTFFSYGRTFYKAPTNRLFGRIHIDQTNTFVINEGGFEGLYEIARVCRMPLHNASRSSIGTNMSSLQCYQAIKDGILIPRNKNMTESFKSAYELLVGDRGGFVYEPRVGIHDHVGEVDFSSMYPNLMINNNISAETVLCACCPNSKLRMPELGYHICEKRVGVVPKVLKVVVTKRQLYKRLREETHDPKLKQIYDSRQAVLKWILVTCFGYLGYKNAKFGTIDGHIGVCAFGRDTFLKTARMAEQEGFRVIHGIVDSLWLQKPDAEKRDFLEFCSKISNQIGIPLNFEGRYKWIVFLPSKIHPRIGVLNRYYGVMENGKVKVRGIEVRKRDTPKFIYDAQTDMIKVLSKANNALEFLELIPQALKVVKDYRQRLLDGQASVWDLIVTKHLSRQPESYRQQVSQVIAAKQLIKEGGQVYAGKNVKFLFTDAQNKHHQKRVKAEPLIEKTDSPDVKKYLSLLYDSAANLLSFLGYTSKQIQEEVAGHNKKALSEYI